MEKDYAKKPALLAYVKDTWLKDHEGKILSVCVDQCMHFGTYTSNRVESEQHRVKREVKSHVATFDTIFRRLDKVMMLQTDNIKSSLEKCRDTKIDWCVRTHGLPCAHKLDQYISSEKGVPLTSIHDFWKKLDIKMTSDVNKIDYDEETYKRLWDDFLSAPLPIRKRLFQNLREGLYPSSTDLMEPDIIKSKGRPIKKSNSRHPSEWEYTEKRYGLDNSKAPVKKSKR
ncbi:hypothetical protein LIER_32100 [Lithospermum erythrorhizon]|uniref:Uncharacterized protein n=1 Tax=Lithospermum erythrorhizon TaxID=34254 RepID=A0AAV3RWR8_LITER